MAEVADDAESVFALPRSLLDTDLYKFTMQQAVLRHFPEYQATYRFTHRDEHVYFSRECYDRFIEAIPHFSEFVATPSEIAWLKQACPYLNDSYLEYLINFRFKPDQVHTRFVENEGDANFGRLEMEAVGPWAETILWEVPLMACLSEIYFRTADTDWNYDSQEELAYEKAKGLLTNGIHFSEFGTRRRRSYHIQDLVIKTLIRASKDFPGQGKLIGTSNVHFACKYGIAPIGTIAHEWFMGVAALRGYGGANARALDLWEQVYPKTPIYVLTDTFSTEAFFKDFVKDKARAERLFGFRQDSGDPLAYAHRLLEVLESMGIDHRTKPILFSDSVTSEKAFRIKKQCDELEFKCSFGIGTYLTNDFRSLSSGGKKQSRALNMVIKIARIDGEPCVKISDDPTKNTGDPEKIRYVKKLYGLPL